MAEQLSRQDDVEQNTVLEFVDPVVGQCSWYLSQSSIEQRIL